MKTPLLIATLLLACCSLRAQVRADSTADTAQYKSNAEKFADSADRLIESDYHYSGHVVNCTVNVVTFTDVLGGKRVTALRLDYNGAVSYVDADELGPLTEAMNAIKEKILATSPADYSEAAFTSRTGFQAGCYRDKATWQFYFRLKRRRPDTLMALKKADFDVFLQILGNVKAKL